MIYPWILLSMDPLLTFYCLTAGSHTDLCLKTSCSDRAFKKWTWVGLCHWIRRDSLSTFDWLHPWVWADSVYFTTEIKRSDLWKKKESQSLSMRLPYSECCVIPVILISLTYIVKCLFPLHLPHVIHGRSKPKYSPSLKGLNKSLVY